MSFYDLTKDNVLSANDLFKHRLKRDATVPSKGGQKAFEPDGSWMHSKALESFIQERTSILGEQRVEKLKSLVQGVWEQDKRLVNLSKPGKFWAHMGFTDNRRNWLYPEEALFLMESNTLEIYHTGIPLSIQEAYNKLIGPDLSLEEYQVYAHLRRLGYVVLRPETELEITQYEKQINLDQYMTKKNRKERKLKLLAKGKNADTGLSTSPPLKNDIDSSDISQGLSSCKDDEAEQATQDPGNSTPENLISTCDTDMCSATLTNQCSKEEQDELGQNVSSSSITNGVKRTLSLDAATSEMPEKRSKTDNESGARLKSVKDEDTNSASFQAHAIWYRGDCWADCFKDLASPRLVKFAVNGNGVGGEVAVKSHKMETDFHEGSSKIDSKEIISIPSIANKNTLSLSIPWSTLLPPNVQLLSGNEDLVFNVNKYRLEHPIQEETKSEQREQERESHIRGLDFSFANWMQRKHKIQARNWAEYKQKAQELKTSSSTQTPVDHLWQGLVTPLVTSQNAQSKKSILDCLDIIQSADNETLQPNSDCMVDLKVSYSVHLPDSKFKKSMPGKPNHRVCVLKCSSEPPNLAEIQEVWSRNKDNIPLHCAVVDSGEIAFYVFDNTFKLDVLT